MTTDQQALSFHFCIVYLTQTEIALIRGMSKVVNNAVRHAVLNVKVSYPDLKRCLQVFPRALRLSMKLLLEDSTVHPSDSVRVDIGTDTGLSEELEEAVGWDPKPADIDSTESTRCTLSSSQEQDPEDQEQDPEDQEQDLVLPLDEPSWDDLSSLDRECDFLSDHDSLLNLTVPVHKFVIPLSSSPSESLLDLNLLVPYSHGLLNGGDLVNLKKLTVVAIRSVYSSLGFNSNTDHRSTRYACLSINGLECDTVQVVGFTEVSVLDSSISVLSILGPHGSLDLANVSCFKYPVVDGALAGMELERVEGSYSQLLALANKIKSTVVKHVHLESAMVFEPLSDSVHPLCPTDSLTCSSVSFEMNWISPLLSFSNVIHLNIENPVMDSNMLSQLHAPKLRSLRLTVDEDDLRDVEGVRMVAPMLETIDVVLTVGTIGRGAFQLLFNTLPNSSMLRIQATKPNTSLFPTGIALHRDHLKRVQLCGFNGYSLLLDSGVGLQLLESPLHERACSRLRVFSVYSDSEVNVQEGVGQLEMETVQDAQAISIHTIVGDQYNMPPCILSRDQSMRRICTLESTASGQLYPRNQGSLSPCAYWTPITRPKKVRRYIIHASSLLPGAGNSLPRTWTAGEEINVYGVDEADAVGRLQSVLGAMKGVYLPECRIMRFEFDSLYTLHLLRQWFAQYDIGRVPNLLRIELEGMDRRYVSKDGQFMID